MLSYEPSLNVKACLFCSGGETQRSEGAGTAEAKETTTEAEAGGQGGAGGRSGGGWKGSGPARASRTNRALPWAGAAQKRAGGAGRQTPARTQVKKSKTFTCC